MGFQDNRPFAAITLLQPRPSVLASALQEASSPKAVPPRDPRFLVASERRYLGWWESLKALCRPTRLHRYPSPVRLFRHTPVVRFRFAGRPLTFSVLLHVCVFLLLPYLPSGSFLRPTHVEAASAEPGKIYYRLTMMNLSRKPPRVVREGRGGHPGGGPQVTIKLPALGSTVVHPKITIVLRPPRLDNRKQTIYQSASAPDLRIAMDLKLPNVLSGTPAVPRPQLHFDPKTSKPMQTKKSVTAELPPALTPGTSLSVISVSELTTTQPHLPVPPPASVVTTSGQSAPPSAGGAPLAGKEERALVIVGVDPSQVESLLALPAGNRWAELTVSPVGGGTGSPGGVSKGERSAGSGAGTGGDASVYVGRGESGGGAGKTGGAGVIGLPGGVGENSGALNPMLPTNMVYPVAASVLPRKNALVVSAGPMGGGGLDVYGALHCGKIYTVFLQMPGKSWTLQFCQSKHEAPANPASGRSTVVTLEQALLPPDPELRFDFRRLPLPPENAHKLILLKGLIREDGTVDLVQVYRGLLPPMDEAARLAFSRWKFKPAMRGGQTVSVEILVGIPSDAPSTRPAY